MATTNAQQSWRERKRLGIAVNSCTCCGKKLRQESREVCQNCWRKTPEGKAYNQHQVASSSEKFDRVSSAKAISNQYKQELGFVNSAALAESNLKGCLEVVDKIGFAHFHHCRNGQTTIYSIAVSKDYLGQGWGRLLFYRVLCSAIEKGSNRIVAKCPIDLSSNEYYKKLGFYLSVIEPGKNRQLNRWQYDIKLPLLFYCADGGRNQYSKIALECGWSLGVNSSETSVNNHCPMIDNDWKKYDHKLHLACVKKHKPLIATARDVEKIEDLPEILKQSRELAKYCGRVLIIPKVKCWLPNYQWLGYSVESTHGFTSVEPEWFGSKLVHLLGGSPIKQVEASKHLNVVSLDGNYAQNVSQNGNVATLFGEFKIQLLGKYGCYEAFEESLKRQKNFWHKIEQEVDFQDLPLFESFYK